VAPPAASGDGGFLGAIGGGGFKLKSAPKPVENTGAVLGHVTDSADAPISASAPEVADRVTEEEDPSAAPARPPMGGGFLGDIGAGGFKLKSAPKPETGGDAVVGRISSTRIAAKADSRTPVAAPKLSFLEEIQKGNSGLKKAVPFAPLPKSPHNGGGLMGLLASKMAMRRNTVKDESDDESVRSGFSSDSD